MTDRQGDGVVVLIAGFFLLQAFWILSGAAGRAFDSAVLESAVKLALWGGGCLAGAYWMVRRHGATVTSATGLDHRVLRGAAFGLVATLPMAAAVFVVSKTRPFNPDMALGSGVLGPLAEELLFRGLLFGVLWRVAQWPVLLAMSVSALLFGYAHGTGVLPMTLGGAVLGWVAYRWGSLWPAVGLHGCMNLWWDLARGDVIRPGAVPDPMSIAQVASVILAVVLTWRGTLNASQRPERSGALTLADGT